jgi:hypothetical protein
MLPLMSTVMLRGWLSPGAKGKMKVCTSCPEGVNSRMRPLPLNTSSLTRILPAVKTSAWAEPNPAASHKTRAAQWPARRTRTSFMVTLLLKVARIGSNYSNSADFQLSKPLQTQREISANLESFS